MICVSRIPPFLRASPQRTIFCHASLGSLTGLVQSGHLGRTKMANLAEMSLILPSAQQSEWMKKSQRSASPVEEKELEDESVDP